MKPGCCALKLLMGIAMAGVLAGCRTAPEGSTRPLYTFSETDLDQYLPVVHAREPDLARRVIRLGRQNIGQPYDIYLLGEFPYEFIDPDPIYCLSRSDCLTFCEHMFSMALSRDWWSFLRTLQRLRYRDGVISMLTRNHYTIADWDRNNAFLFEDLTATLGGGAAAVPLKQVCKRAAFFAKFGIGQDIPDEPIADHYIPKENVPGILGELRDGDFVNIIRGDADSQYAGHTGLIAHAPDGTVDFLHSASPAVREQPLTDYLTKDRKCLGIKILRLRPDAARRMAAALAASPQATEVSAAALETALAASPVMTTGAPPSYVRDWAHAMHLQSYNLEFDTPLDPELQPALEALERQVGEKLGIPDEARAFGVLDLTNLRAALVRPDSMFYGASVPKICIVMAYFATHPEAVANLDPAIERELQLVIKRSDNELAAKYSQLVGLEKIQELIGSKRYAFYDKEHGGGLWCGKHYGIAEPRYGDPLHDHSHGATVRQCLRYYLMLEQGKLVSAEVCGKLKEIFAAPRLEFHNKDFVRGLNGRDVTILRKGGLWEDWHLDTARVQHGEHLYLLAGMTQHARGEEYLAEMAAAVDDLLCGPQPPLPYTHHAIAHTDAASFQAGTIQYGALADDGRGVILSCAGAQAGTYESPVLDTDFWFNEVVASWNVDTPEQAGFRFEVRVGRQDTGVWSPYLSVGEWGAVTLADERIETCEQGKIDVDYFRSPDYFDRVQYRIRTACAEGQSATLRVRRVDLCLSDLTGIPPALPRPEPEAVMPPSAWQRRLPVPFRTQATNVPEFKGQICSPTSVSMVLSYRGVESGPEDVARLCYDPVHKLFGGWPRAVQAAYALDVPGYLARFSGWSDVERMIAAGQPLIISIRAPEVGMLTGAPYKSTTGHLIVVTGFDAEGRVLVNDPAVRTPEEGCRAYLRGDLEKVWMRQTGGLAYVLLPRE